MFKQPNRYYTFLLLSLIVSSIISYVYLTTHSFPAVLGGLYLDMAKSIGSNGWKLPVYIDGYTIDSLPFAYPPLAFYIIELLSKAGLSRLQILRVGSPLLLLSLVGLMYHLTFILFDDCRIASIAGIIVGINITLNQLLIAGSGFVRTLGFIFTIMALIGAYQYFVLENRSSGFAIASGGWGLSVLTHPVHAAAAGIGVFAVWLLWNRSIRGLAVGTAIAVVGLVIASPWWVTVIFRHGIEVFFIGASSHGSFTHSPRDILGLGYSFWGADPLGWIPTMALIGGLLLFIRGQWKRVFWLSIPVLALVPPHGRLLLIPMAPLSAFGLMKLATFLAESYYSQENVFSPNLSDEYQNRIIILGIMALFILPLLGISGIMVSDTSPGSALPELIDDNDRAAMDWIKEETDTDAQIVAIGASNEWLPYFTDRTSLITPYGAEWIDGQRYGHHKSMQDQLVDCQTASCINSILQTNGLAKHTDYVYVPNGTFATRFNAAVITPATHRSLAESDQFTSVFSNQGVVIYRYENQSDPTQSAAS